MIRRKGSIDMPISHLYIKYLTKVGKPVAIYGGSGVISGGAEVFEKNEDGTYEIVIKGKRYSNVKYQPPPPREPTTKPATPTKN